MSEWDNVLEARAWSSLPTDHFDGFGWVARWWLIFAYFEGNILSENGGGAFIQAGAFIQHYTVYIPAQVKFNVSIKGLWQAEGFITGNWYQKLQQFLLHQNCFLPIKYTLAGKHLETAFMHAHTCAAFFTQFTRQSLWKDHALNHPDSAHIGIVCSVWKTHSALIPNGERGFS